MIERMKILELAFSQYGIREFPGLEKNNPEILKYFDIIGEKWVIQDEISWCSAFANWVCKKAGLEYSGKLNARSWLKVGLEVGLPVLGDVVILWREGKDSWKGHVGFYIKSDDNYIWVLGGNQDNQVKISIYPKFKLLGYRRLWKD